MFMNMFMNISLYLDFFPYLVPNRIFDVSFKATTTNEQEPGGGDESAFDENQKLLRQILERLKYVEAFVKSTGGHSAVTQAAKRQRGGMAGFRNGVAPTMGFDVPNKKALPLCNKCSVGGKKFYHLYKDCVLGGRRHTPGTAAAYCQPAAE
eukprot:gene33954-43895_t